MQKDESKPIFRKEARRVLLLALGSRWNRNKVDHGLVLCWLTESRGDSRLIAGM